MIERIGELSALVTAVSWTIGAMIFEGAVRRTSVIAVNTLKVFFGSIYLAILAAMTAGGFFPLGLSAHAWLFMGASGFLGFVIGDYFLFTAYSLVGSRLSMLLMSVSVPLTVIASAVLFGEAPGRLALLGMTATLGGIILTVQAGGRSRRAEAGRGSEGSESGSALQERRSFAEYRKGVLYGLLSAVAMAGSTLLTKVGSAGVHPVAATQVRIFAALAGFLAVAAIGGKTGLLKSAVTNRRSLGIIALGSVFGPFIGVGCLLFALQHADAGVVSTISSLSPVLIIPPSILILKKKVDPLEIIGACVAVGGVSLLFL